MGKDNWKIAPIGTRDSDERLFFDEHQWATVDAAAGRIIPTDHHPGAQEAEVVRFIDRYLAGTEFIYASARGDGFLCLEGEDEQAWEERVADHRKLYQEGLKEIDQVSKLRFGGLFIELSEDEQDDVLVEVSGEPRPGPFSLTEIGVASGRDAPAANAPVQGPGGDEGLDFFHALVLHTRQGFYADPVYGGNRDRIGWRVIGFDGPLSLRDTTDGSYTTMNYMLPDAEWPYDQHPSVLGHE